MCYVSGCAPVALTAFGVGSATGVEHTLSGIAYKTFTMPLPTVRAGALKALARMDIKAGSPAKTESGELIKATTSNRNIEIELEAISPNTTRMRTTAHDGVFMDSATATEIIIQTQKILS